MIRKLLQEKLRAVAWEAGFGTIMPLLLSSARECLHIVQRDSRTGGEIGSSRLGGSPDLPPGLAWPAGVDAAGSRIGFADFIAQFALSDLPRIDGFPLPNNGYLWLFMRGITTFKAEMTVVFEGGTPILTRRADPTVNMWGTAISSGYSDCSKLLRGEIAVGFELGVDLPFGDYAFLREIRKIGDWHLLSEKLLPVEMLGQIAGYAYSSEAIDYCRLTGLTILGKQEFWTDKWFLQYNNIDDLENGKINPPSFIRTEQEVARWNARHDELRPKVAWIEQNRSKIFEWQSFLRLDENRQVGLELSQNCSLWMFCRLGDVSSRAFEQVISTINTF